MQEEKIIYEEENKETVSNSIIAYIQKEGIWALYGRKPDVSKHECLNVGKCKDVGKEILYDLGCLHFVGFRDDIDDDTKPYINQFNDECQFRYKANQVQEYLYPYLATQYCAFRFVYVYDKSDREKETEYAKEKHAKFWRNGAPYRISKKPN